MKDFEKLKPKKYIWSKRTQNYLLKRVIKFIKKDLLPNNNINEILIFGSLAKKTFGRYNKEWKHGKYSDIDILLLVNNTFKIPKKWKLWAKTKDMEVYTNNYFEKKYLIQYMIYKKRKYSNKKIKKEAEPWGIPLLKKASKNKYIEVYKKGV